tara:strand:+ start:1561 stop:1860 length:300 start_codon:yes stop_codon:yes gene_type:complete
MKNYFTYRNNLVAAYFAVICFAVGNLIFLLLLASRADVVVVLAIVFALLWAILTPFATLFLLVNLLFNIKDIQEHVAAIFMVVMNVPIAILYYNLILSV